MKPTIYIETTIVSYLTSRISKNPVIADRQRKTIEWWKEILPQVEGFASTAVIEEAAKGDRQQAQIRTSALNGLEILPVTQEVLLLSDELAKILQLPLAAKTDSIHLAVSSIHEIEYFLTWNCAHLAGVRVRKLLEKWEARTGKHVPLICTPEEFTEI